MTDSGATVDFVAHPSPSSLDPGQIFPFPLDPFQLQAMAALAAGRSVVVCAPTGSGKTLVGEYAIHRALAGGKRVFYTTPLKALSNQKLRDFREALGAEQVGLLTGDLCINREAPILVMTTEIFRNMLYGTPIGEVGTSLTGLEAVILDECHYMNDPQRGTVWEETIIYCPREIQLVALSATVANSAELTAWIERVHGPTELVYSTYRPVPLQFFFGHDKGIFPLLNDQGTGPNPRIKPQRPRGNLRQQGVPNLTEIVMALRERDMLPAIYFIFSRRGCDQAVAALTTVNLLTTEEAENVRAQLVEFLQRNPQVGQTLDSPLVSALGRGIAAHHAGVLPVWKSLIETLFQQGLIKVVFATETLAAGINMPARTTVISSLSKRTDSGHRLLFPSEFLQMAGRAGRRGMDTQGYVVTLQTPFEGIREAAQFALADPDPLASKFTPSYGMVLNLLQRHTLAEARDLVERSFGQFLSTQTLGPEETRLAQLQTQYQTLQSSVGQVNPELVAQYEKLYQRHKESLRLLKVLEQQSQEGRRQDLGLAVNFAVTGTMLNLRPAGKGGHAPIPAVLVAKVAPAGRPPLLICLGRDNTWRVAAVEDVLDLHAELPRLAAVDTLAPPTDLVLKPGQQRPGFSETAPLAAQVAVPFSPDLPPEVLVQREEVQQLAEALTRHPGRPPDKRFFKHRQQLQALEAEIRQETERLEAYKHQYWRQFANLMDILVSMGCLENGRPTALGETVAAVRGDNELWLGLALASGDFDHLAPNDLAAVCMAIVLEVGRTDSWARYPAVQEAELALAKLRPLRRKLFQLQRRAQVTFPIWLETDLISLVERWVAGVDWADLCAHTNLDGGDIVRLLRRTGDFLSQIPHVPHLPASLRDSARLALTAMNRFPVDEDVED